MRRPVFAIACLVLAGCATPRPAGVDTTQRADEVFGCWVNFFGQEQYRLPVTTYTGPSQQSRVERSWRSAVVGPHARLTGYRGEFREATLVLRAGARVPDLGAIDFPKKVDSFKLACVDQDTPPATRGR